MERYAKNNKKKARACNQSGFTLFIAVVTVSILLLVTLSISSIAAKELILTASGREATTAFYVANSGIECALYWDLKNDGGVEGAFIAPPPSIVTCNGQSQNVGQAPLKYPFTTRLSFDFDNHCSKVNVNKYLDSAKNIKTKIESLGYNLPCSSITSPRTIERAIRVTY